MTRHDRTSIGDGDHWKTTQWSEILKARTDSPENRRQALDDIFRLYWRPAYCYFRRAGFDNETAKDLTQDFFATADRRQLVERADPERGRFRALMLTALKHHAAQFRRHRGALCRSAHENSVPLDAVPELPEGLAGDDPSAAFDYAWATTTLDRAIAQARQECLEAGQATHWTVFFRRDLAALINGGQPPGLPELAETLLVDSVEQLSAMRVTAQRRFRRTLRRLVSETLADDEDVDAEIGRLVEALSRGLPSVSR